VGAEIIKLSPEQKDFEITWLTTPGHTGDSCSLIVKGENVSLNGTAVKSLALVGDLWDFETDDDVWRDMSEDHESQIKSRNYVGAVLKPDLVIPGHGPPFSGPYKSY